MTMNIWKFPLAIIDAQEVEMPIGAKILATKVQPGVFDALGTPCIWALVDPTAKLVKRRVRIVGTGHAIEADPGEFLDTFFLADGALVFHVFIGPEGA